MRQPLYPWERPGTHCIGGWVGPITGLDGCRKSHPPAGFEPWAIQPEASRYTDWISWPTVSYPSVATVSSPCCNCIENKCPVWKQPSWALNILWRQPWSGRHRTFLWSSSTCPRTVMKCVYETGKFVTGLAHTCTKQIPLDSFFDGPLQLVLKPEPTGLPLSTAEM